MTAVHPTTSLQVDSDLLAALLSGERFWPSDPESLEQAGLSDTLLEALICKVLLSRGDESGRGLASFLCLPLTTVEPTLARLRKLQVVVHRGAGLMNDYYYGLTDEGRRRAKEYQRECSYVGPAPVPLMDYILSVEAQADSEEPIRRSDLIAAFHEISIERQLLDVLGPAVNSRSGIFLYGAPGNGKSTLAQRLTGCFGQEIWLPYAIIEGHEIIKLYDPAYHQPLSRRGVRAHSTTNYDRRWIRVRRPTVVVGGELTMDALEIRHDPVTGVGEAPLQMKSNCGCLLIDDFGRQRISPENLLNRWIIPLESRHDFLTLGSGKKIQVPFQQLIIFSTNLAPENLVDEAFIRRIPYRIEVKDPGEEEFHHLFQLAAEKLRCEYDGKAVEHLLSRYYRPLARPLRRCHPRDLLQQVRNFCDYQSLPFAMLPEYFDRIGPSFFTVVGTKPIRHDDTPRAIPRGPAA
jgi:hypothetical protein